MRRKPKVDLSIELEKPREQVQLLARVDSELHAEADRIRKELGHSWVEIVEAALEAYVKKFGDGKGKR